MLLSEAAKRASKGILFDVTIDERLPEEFTDLSRWSKQEVLRFSQQLNLELTDIYDIGETWVIIRGEH